MEKWYNKIRNRLFKLQKMVARVGEIPIVALVYIPDKKRYYLGYNNTKSMSMATAHAEMIAIHRAMKRLHKEWLKDAILFSTLEPCFMCFYASILARVDKVIYFVKRSKISSVELFSSLWRERMINHLPNSKYIEDKRAKNLLKAFFKCLRKNSMIKLSNNDSDYFFV
jgi:tRNA(adenine34) deaminase